MNNEDLVDRNWETTSQSNVSIATHTTATADKLRARLMREQIRSSLDQLPKARNDYQIELPDIETLDADQEGRAKAIDQEDVEKTQRELEAHRQKEAEKQISSTVRRDLPRPYKINFEFQEVGVTSTDEQLKDAELMIGQEMNILLNRDATLHPFKGSEGGQNVDYDYFENFEIESASKLINEEIESLKRERKHLDWKDEDYLEAWDARAKKIHFDPISRE